jgi:NAD+ synthase (glutamine-hydrolysing)
MKLSIAQVNTTAGDFRGNADRIISAIERARSDGSQLVAFPEAAIQGYTSGDWFLDGEVVNATLSQLDRVVQATEGISAVVGTVRPAGLAAGKKLFNSAAVIHDRKLLGFADKTLLPSYEVFDEPRYFESANGCALFDIGELRLGVAVCEDFWNDQTFWSDRLYEYDPTEDLLKQGANLIVSVNASPFHKGKPAVRRRMVEHRARTSGVPMLFMNLVGGNDGSIFDGSSLIAAGNGEIVLQAPAFQEFVGTADMDRRVADARSIPENEEAIDCALALGIRDFVRKTGFERAIVPLAGNLNDRVVTVLACKALGAANVVGLISADTLTRAEEGEIHAFASKLGIQLERPHYSAVENCCVTLSSFSRTDAALGHSTSGEGLAVLGDLFVTEIVSLGKYLEGSGDLPETQVGIESMAHGDSAEWALKHNSNIEEIDSILRDYLEKNLSPRDIIAAGRDQRIVYDVLNRVEAPWNEIRRRAMPVVLAVSRGAFGPARRRPIAHCFRWPLDQIEL